MEEQQKTIEVKRLRPWVKNSVRLLGAITIYAIVRTWVYQPKPYVVQFDLERIQGLKEGRQH